MDYGRHQTQHAARALEGLKRRPVLVEPVEHLGMDGVAAHHAVAVLELAGIDREVGGVLAVHLAERVAYGIALCRVLAVEEQTPAYHLEALVRAHGLPDGLHAPKGVLDGLKRTLAALAANLALALGDGRHHQAALGGACGLGQFLDERDEVVKRACGQLLHAEELLGVCHELIHEHQSASASVEHLGKCLRSGRYTASVGIAHVLVERRVALGYRKLVGNLAPDGIHGDARHVGGPLGLRRVQSGADDDGDVHLGHLVDASGLKHGQRVGDLPDAFAAAQQVVQGQHAVRLATAERGL